MWFHIFVPNAINFSNRSIWSINGILTYITTPVKSGPGNEEVLDTPQKASLSDVSVNPGHMLEINLNLGLYD